MTEENQVFIAVSVYDGSDIGGNTEISISIPTFFNLVKRVGFAPSDSNMQDIASAIMMHFSRDYLMDGKMKEVFASQPLAAVVSDLARGKESLEEERDRLLKEIAELEAEEKKKR